MEENELSEAGIMANLEYYSEKVVKCHYELENNLKELNYWISRSETNDEI